MQSSARSAESLARQAHSYAASLAGDPELAAAYNAACSAAEAADRRAEQARREAEAAERAVVSAEQEVEKARSELKIAEGEQRAAENALEMAKQAVQEAERALQEAERAVQEAERAVQEAERALAAAEEEAREAERLAIEAAKAKEAEEKARKLAEAEKARVEAERREKEAEVARAEVERKENELKTRILEAEKAAKEAQAKVVSENEQKILEAAESLEKLQIDHQDKNDLSVKDQDMAQQKKDAEASLKKKQDDRNGNDGVENKKNDDMAQQKKDAEPSLKIKQQEIPEKLSSKIEKDTLSDLLRKNHCTEEKISTFERKLELHKEVHEQKVQQAQALGVKPPRRKPDPIQQFVQKYNKQSLNKHDKLDMLKNAEQMHYHSNDGTLKIKAAPTLSDLEGHGCPHGTLEKIKNKPERLAWIQRDLEKAPNFYDRRNILENGKQTLSFKSDGSMSVKFQIKQHKTNGKLDEGEIHNMLKKFANTSVLEKLDMYEDETKRKIVTLSRTIYNGSGDYERKVKVLENVLVNVRPNSSINGDPDFRDITVKLAYQKPGAKFENQDHSHMNPNSIGCDGFNSAVIAGRWEDAVNIAEFNFSAANVFSGYTNRRGQMDADGKKRGLDLITDSSAEDALNDGTYCESDVDWKGEQIAQCVNNYKILAKEGKMKIGGLECIIAEWVKYDGWEACVKKFNINAEL